MLVIKKLARTARQRARRLTPNTWRQKIQRRMEMTLFASAVITVIGLYLIYLGAHHVVGLVSRAEGRRS